MTDIMAPWPEMPGALVVARFARVHGDGSDDDDRPDWIAPSGTELTFTPSITGTLVYDPAGAKIIIELAPFHATVDADGYAVARDGGHPIRLAPTNELLMSRTGWLWTCSWPGGKVSFPAPSSGAVNLADFIVAPPGNPVVEEWVARIPEMIDAANAAAAAGPTAVDAAAVAVAARDTATGAASTATDAASTAAAARDATLAASTIVGAGRPDVPASMTAAVQTLVSAATSGAVFRSTDGPQGAWEWRKRGSTWACIEGDTGWRTIPITATGVTGLGLYPARIKRDGTRVEVIIDRITFDADYVVGTVVVPYPAEFGPSIGVKYLPRGAAYAAASRAATAIPTGVRFHEAGALPDFRAAYTWTAISAWPTTLPGSAS